MDGTSQRPNQQVDVDRVLQVIKARMPSTYRSIQSQADVVGRQAYAMVRRAIAGQPNVFWACEAGHVVGTPFTVPDITADVAQTMVAFGSQSVVIWAKGADDGAH